MQTKVNVLVSSSFEYLCYGSTAIIIMLILSVQGTFLNMYNDGPRAERVENILGWRFVS